MKMAMFFGSLGEDRSPEEAEVGGSYEPHRLQGHVFLALGDGISGRSLHISSHGSSPSAVPWQVEKTEKFSAGDQKAVADLTAEMISKACRPSLQKKSVVRGPGAQRPSSP